MWIKCSESSEDGESPGWGDGERFTGEAALKVDSDISVGVGSSEETASLEEELE